MEEGLVDVKDLFLKEIADGIQSVTQLRTKMLLNPGSYREDEASIQSLLDNTLSSFDKSISLAKLLKFRDNQGLGIISPATSQPSSKQLFPSGKRKRMGVATKLVEVRVDDGLNSSPLNDGFSWRKYGQKDILKSKYPRGYYRCTHRYSQGCDATKQVQRLDEDPSICRVIYKGDHRCTSLAHFSRPTKKPNTAQTNNISQLLSIQHQQNQTHQEAPSALGSMPEPTAQENEAQIFQSFASLDAAQNAQGLFDLYSPKSWSPPAIDFNYFLTAPPCSLAGIDLGLNVKTSESDASESMSGWSSVANSPNVGHFGFPVEDELPDIDVDFFFDF